MDSNTVNDLKKEIHNLKIDKLNLLRDLSKLQSNMFVRFEYLLNFVLTGGNFFMFLKRFLRFFIDFTLNPVKYNIVPFVYRIINRLFPPTKIAFALNMGLMGGTEMVTQKHIEYTQGYFKSHMFFQHATGPVAQELRKNFKVFGHKVLSYFLLRYKYIYFAQTLPNVSLIKRANPNCKISFIIHEHLSGWLETFETFFDIEYIDHIFFISEFVRKKFFEKITWYPIEKTSILYNPYLNGNNNLEYKIPKKDNAFTIGYLGRISPEKNILSLIEIFNRFNKKYPESRLVIAGPVFNHTKEYADEFFNKIRENKQIEYLGVVGKNEKIKPENFFEKINCLAFSSFVEGVPLTALEALSYGVPIISTNVGALHEFINNSNGMLVDIQKINFNPFHQMNPPFKKLSETDIDNYVKTLYEFKLKKWDNYSIMKDLITKFGDQASKERFITEVKKIINHR